MGWQQIEYWVSTPISSGIAFNHDSGRAQRERATRGFFCFVVLWEDISNISTEGLSDGFVFCLKPTRYWESFVFNIPFVHSFKESNRVHTLLDHENGQRHTFVSLCIQTLFHLSWQKCDNKGLGQCSLASFLTWFSTGYYDPTVPHQGHLLTIIRWPIGIAGAGWWITFKRGEISHSP